MHRSQGRPSLQSACIALRTFVESSRPPLPPCPTTTSPPSTTLRSFAVCRSRSPKPRAPSRRRRRRRCRPRVAARDPLAPRCGAIGHGLALQSVAEALEPLYIEVLRRTAALMVAGLSAQEGFELLVYVSSPASEALPFSSDEVERIEALPGQIKVEKGGDGEGLRALLADLKPRYLLFIGHADIAHPHSKRATLGLTDATGAVVNLNPGTIANLLGRAEGLELVVLNGCRSEAWPGPVVRARNPGSGRRTSSTKAATSRRSLDTCSTRSAPLNHCGNVSPAYRQAKLAITCATNGQRTDGTRSNPDAVPTSGAPLAAGVPYLLAARAGECGSRRCEALDGLTEAQETARHHAGNTAPFHALLSEQGGLCGQQSCSDARRQPRADWWRHEPHELHEVPRGTVAPTFSRVARRISASMPTDEHFQDQPQLRFDDQSGQRLWGCRDSFCTTWMAARRTCRRWARSRSRRV